MLHFNDDVFGGIGDGLMAIAMNIKRQNVDGSGTYRKDTRAIDPTQVHEPQPSTSKRTDSESVDLRFDQQETNLHGARTYK